MLGEARIRTVLRWLVLPLAIGVTHVAFEDTAHAKTKKSSSKKKKTGPSMDDTAGRDVDEGGTAPGTHDSKTEEVEVVPETPKKPKPGETQAEEVTLEESDAPPSAPPAPPPPYALNWLSIGVQQDFLIYGNTPNVCPSADQNGHEFDGHGGYSCRDADAVHKEPVYHGAGNEVHGGFGLATLRINIGYDRVVGPNFMLGARFGLMLLQAPGVTGSKAPKPLGGEARVAYYFGASPFESRSVRPFAALAGGFAEVDGKVSVQYYKDHIAYQSNQPGTLEVWHITGPGFAALSGGIGVPFGGFMLNVEARMQVMFPTFAVAPALALTLAYGL